MDLKNLIAYWHSSLCDAELMGIEMGGPASVQVPTTDIEQGKLDPKITRSLLQQQAEAESSEADISSGQSVSIVIAPLIVRQTYHHGYTKGSKPKTIWPLLIPAVLQKDGAILPDREGLLPWIPRTLLEPTSAELVFGEIQTFDEFLTNNALFLNEDPQQAWYQFLDYGWKMLRFVTKEQGQELIQEAGYTEIEGQSVVINASNVRGIANNILKVYDRLLRLETPPPLLYSYANVKPQPSSSPLSPQQWSKPAQRHLGSVNNQFPLSPSQREAFYNFLALPSYTTLAVSGPPGTGKTTLLHSVIASLWTEAAIEGKNPPVIVATSTNNQAVTNVIDSLGHIDDVERWLPINSFGLYLVNSRERQVAADAEGKLWINKMGDGFPTQVETLVFVSEARKQYLNHCATFFNQEVETVSDAVILLHEKLNKTAQWMRDGIIIAYKLFATKAQWAQLNVQDGHGSESYAAKLERQLNEAQAQYERYQEIHQQWMRHQIDEPVQYSLFPFVPTIRRNRRLRNALFLNEFIPNSDVEPEKNLITEWIEKQLRQAKVELEKMQEVTTPAQIEKRLAQLETAWQTWCYQANVSTLDIDQLFTLEAADGETESRCLLNWLDTQSRYDLFTLATHYWEGRWLLEVEALGLTQPNFRERQDRETQESRWRRYAFLTPCFVTTMHTGSSFFDYYQGQPEPLFDFIDLLIVDEAGQVPPEVSGAMFALAKQALVVGDTLQIEPVWSIPDAVDRGNLESHGLISNDENFFQIKGKGFTASSGSVMKMAQEASPYQQLNAAGIIAERGMFLAEHRRCVPEIIGYCNDLAYGGRLRPKRPSISNHPWPHMGYVHVKGESHSAGGSRQNQREATAVTAWITDNRSSLEKHYQTDIDNIIGIITPFAAQKRLLVDGLAAQGIVVSKVGTVHALQGAERPVVIFSSVYSAHDTGPYFFDRGPNMLNVAVSRAKDNFLVIGDMDIFDPDLSTPSGLLARYLFAEESNELVDAPLPPRPDSQTTKKTDRVRTLDKHRAVLARAFARAKNRLVIVSPYLRWRAVSADDIGSKVAQARARGVEVVIYVDDSFNENLLFPSAAKAAETLRQNGATVHICHNIHSKIICIDTDVFVEGSFNWLSAERTIQKFTRYETSTIHLGESARLYIEETLHDIQERLKT
jgi:hypothetical protein